MRIFNRPVFLALFIVFPLLSAFPVRGQSVDTVKILITAPAGYSERFQKQFEASNLEPYPVPMIETLIPVGQPETDYLLRNLSEFDYIAFSSRKAIEAFANRLDVHPEAREAFSKVKCCAIGKDAEYMHERLGVVDAVEPDEPSPMGIARKLAGIPGIKGKKIAVLAPAVEGIPEPNVVPDFLLALELAGLDVTRVNAYLTRPVSAERLQSAVDLIEKNRVACVAFTSSAEIEVLLNALKDRGPKHPFFKLKVACFGPYTASYARKKGLKVAIVAKDYSSFAGFIEAIEQYFKK